MAAIFVMGGDRTGADSPVALAGGVTTSSTYYDSIYSNSAFTTAFNYSYHWRDFTPQTDFWVHMDVYMHRNGNIDSRDIEFYNTTESQVVLRVMGYNGVRRLEYWDGGAFQQILSPIGDYGQDSKRLVLDFHIKLHATEGVFAVYADSELIAEYTGDTLLFAATNVDRLYIRGPSNGSDTHGWSQIFGYPTSTIGLKLLSLDVTGEGAVSQFDGSYTDINQTGFNHEKYLKTDTVDQISTYTMTDMITQDPQNLYVVKEVIVQSRVMRGSTGPQNFQHVIRSGGTNYFSSSHSLSVGLVKYQTDSWEVDPNTSADWTDSAITGIEIGFKSLT